MKDGSTTFETVHKYVKKKLSKKQGCEEPRTRQSRLVMLGGSDHASLIFQKNSFFAICMGLSLRENTVRGFLNIPDLCGTMDRSGFIDRQFGPRTINS